MRANPDPELELILLERLGTLRFKPAGLLARLILEVTARPHKPHTRAREAEVHARKWRRLALPEVFR